MASQVRKFAREWMGKIAYSKRRYERQERWVTRPMGRRKDVKTWVLVDREVTGWVVGIRTIYNGETEFEYEAGHIWTAMGGLRVALISPRPDSKIVRVPLEDLEHFEGEYVFTYNQPAYSDRYKEVLRRDAAAMPRDEKGRFLPLDGKSLPSSGTSS